MLEIYKAFEGESSFTKMFEKRDAEIDTPDGYTGWNEGYLMGWANAEYSEDTEFLIDDVAISTDPLL